MQSENFIKNLISKDINVSKNTIANLIKSKNIEQFKLLVKNCDFIFPNIKQRIINDFVKIINITDLDLIFEFSKIYCEDFEDIIVKSWLKFADDDLTDRILELFEKGGNDQKAYCAKYFYFINDPLALDYLINEAKTTDFEPLRGNCAMALCAFKNSEVLDYFKDLIKNSNDEFEKLKAYNFIINYKNEEDFKNDDNIKFVIQNAFKSPFSANIISNILDLYDFSYISKILNNDESEDEICLFVQTIIENYPENISLESVYYWDVYGILKYLSNFNNQYSKNILFLAKTKFDEFNKNDIYTFDLDRNTKNEVRNISNYLNSLKLDFDNLKDELDTIEHYEEQRFNLALEVIKELKLDYSDILIQKFKINLDNKNYTNCAKIASVLSLLNKKNMLDKNMILSIDDNNIKALIESYA